MPPIGAPTGGTFSLTFTANGVSETTTDLAFNSNAAAVQAALESLSTIGTGNVSVTSADSASWPELATYYLDFAASLGNVEPLQPNDHLVGGLLPVGVVATIHQGNPAAAMGIAVDTEGVNTPAVNQKQRLGWDICGTEDTFTLTGNAGTIPTDIPEGGPPFYFTAGTTGYSDVANRISGCESSVSATYYNGQAIDVTWSSPGNFTYITPTYSGTTFGQEFFNYVAAVQVAEVQTIAFTGVTGGTYQLVFEGETTSALAWNANAATVEGALNALSTIGSGVGVTGDHEAGLDVTFTAYGTQPDLSYVANLLPVASGERQTLRLSYVVLPPVDQVAEGESYGLDGTEYEGEYVSPAPQAGGTYVIIFV